MIKLMALVKNECVLNILSSDKCIIKYNLFKHYLLIYLCISLIIGFNIQVFGFFFNKNTKYFERESVKLRLGNGTSNGIMSIFIRPQNVTLHIEYTLTMPHDYYKKKYKNNHRAEWYCLHMKLFPSW